MRVFMERLPRTAAVMWALAFIVAVPGWTKLSMACALMSAVSFGWWAWNKWGLSRYLRMVVWSIRWGGKLNTEQRAVLARLGFDWRVLAARTKLGEPLRPLSLFAMKIGDVEAPRVTQVRAVGRNLEVDVRMPVGETTGTLRDKAEALAASAEVQEVRVKDGTDLSRAMVIVPTGQDPLAATVDLARMPQQGESGAPIPVAVDENMTVVSVGTAHMLALGATGSGKGSAIWSRLMAQAPRLAEGTLRLYGCDSKESEVKAAEQLFCQTAYTAEEHARLFKHVRRELERRGKDMPGRSFVASREWPEIVMVIDEITSLTSIFDDAKSRNAAMADLRMILSLGRSRGITVIGAGQDPTKEALSLRNLFPQAIALRLRDATETRLALGEGAAEAGATPHQIPVASAANGYASAGVGWLADENGTLRRARFPCVSDDAISAFEQAFSDHRGHGCARDPERAEMTDAA